MQSSPDPKSPLRPEWLRLPLVGKVCPLTGLGHVRLVRLLAQAGGANAFTRLRPAGGQRAVTLIKISDFLSYLERSAASLVEERRAVESWVAVGS